MNKGKGVELSFRSRGRSFIAPGTPVVTRLTRTMGFMELPQNRGDPVSLSPSMPEFIYQESNLCHHPD
jgi:hypothetical protein